MVLSKSLGDFKPVYEFGGSERTPLDRKIVDKVIYLQDFIALVIHNLMEEHKFVLLFRYGNKTVIKRLKKEYALGPCNFR